jgi:hypothetical protein
MIEDGTMKIGGNQFRYKLGKRIKKMGEKMMERGKYKIVTNPSCKLINPFTLMINFTLDNTEKYQVVLQGDYKQHYKESDGSDVTLHKIPDIPERDIYILINQSQAKWYKKS